MYVWIWTSFFIYKTFGHWNMRLSWTAILFCFNSLLTVCLGHRNCYFLLLFYSNEFTYEETQKLSSNVTICMKFIICYACEVGWLSQPVNQSSEVCHVNLMSYSWVRWGPSNWLSRLFELVDLVQSLEPRGKKADRLNWISKSYELYRSNVKLLFLICFFNKIIVN